MQTEQGPCTCHQLQDPGRFGTVMYTEGCLALIPVQLADGSSCVPRPKDPLPVTGRQARKAAVSALNWFASQVGGGGATQFGYHAATGGVWGTRCAAPQGA